MAVTKQKKETILGTVESAVGEAVSIVFVRSRGMPVTEVQAMRRALKAAGVKYYVAKKTLIKRALAAQGYAGTLPVLEGELAIAWGNDPVAPAREVQQFVKSAKEKVVIMGGVFEGRYLSAAEMSEVAAIPSQLTLYAQFVMLINSPIQQFVMALDQIAQKKEASA